MNDIIEEKNEFKKIIKSIHKNNIICFQAHSKPTSSKVVSGTTYALLPKYVRVSQ